ncbi:MAG: c-type cytochrome [Alphaproteobacteria bacterium]|nr:c-type cytochrome [Alphaproteobacteria bacterium]
MPSRKPMLAMILVGVAIAGGGAAAQDLAKKGEYLFHAAGCAGCHTDVATKGPLLAGGRALKTPFGTFYSPNITSDRTHGIGTWTDADFVKAMKGGIDKGGRHLFPAFPFPSYAGMADDDAKAIKAYIFTLPAVAKPNRTHDVSPPFGWRIAAWGWQLLFFGGPAFPPAPVGASDEVKRGHYLANALGHCGECHTPRNWFGALDPSKHLGGNPTGPGGRIPNITPDKTGIADASADDLITLLDSGMKPDGDVVGGEMYEVIQETTSKLTPEDRKALAAYLKAIPPVHMEPRKK